VPSQNSKGGSQSSGSAAAMEAAPLLFMGFVYLSIKVVELAIAIVGLIVTLTIAMVCRVVEMMSE
jgi:hypothetical protein